MEDFDRHDASLTAALRALAAIDGRAGASAAVEARLLAEARSIARARRRRTLAAFLPIAAALILAVAAAVWQSTARPPVARMGRVALLQRGEAVTAFFPLAYSHVPASGAQIVRLQVPLRALRSFGLASANAPDGGSSGTVLADVLVGDDGLARAVRFVHPTMHLVEGR